MQQAGPQAWHFDELLSSRGPRPGPRAHVPAAAARGLRPARTHLCALVSLVYEPPEVKHHVPGEGLQLLRSHIRDLQPLQVKHVLLVVGHLWGHGDGLQRLGREQPQGS